MFCRIHKHKNTYNTTSPYTDIKMLVDYKWVIPTVTNGSLKIGNDKESIVDSNTQHKT